MHADVHAPSHQATRRLRALIAIAGITASTLLAATGCSGNIHHTYRTFQSALDRGASCSELYGQRARFHDNDTLAKIDNDLQVIGCTSATATRTD